MQNRFFFFLCALALVTSGCERHEPEREYRPPVVNDAAFLLDGLVKEVAGEYIPFRGVITGDALVIPALSVAEAETHFLSLLPPDASPRSQGGSIVWSMTDDQGAAQGDAVFTPGESPLLATVSLPESFPGVLKTVIYKPATGLLSAVDPAVQEDLEDNYFYGAIVQIADHGCGSGKFVVLREYDFDTGAAGMAIRLDSRHWDDKEMNYKDTGSQVYGRASCLSTMQTAGGIIRKDMKILSKQLRNAGSTTLGQHFVSSTTTWNGWHYYYCLHDDESGWIGPVHDTDFYECWIYWFVPSGSGIKFW